MLKDVTPSKEDPDRVEPISIDDLGTKHGCTPPIHVARMDLLVGSTRVDSDISVRFSRSTRALECLDLETLAM